MSEVEHKTPRTLRPKAPSHSRVVAACLGIVVAMGGLAYASVPLYRLFCQVTGYGGTTQRAERAPAEILERTITVRFDANVQGGLAWRFEPLDKPMAIKIGDTGLATYRATNTGSEPVIGTATYNVVPDQAGAYFNKLQCFCFTEQRLEPGQSMDMAVQFFVDPAIVKDPDASKIRDITLSYTFYPVTAAKKGVAETPANGKPRT